MYSIQYFKKTTNVKRQHPASLSVLLLLLLLVQIFLLFTLNTVPATSRDALIQHLAIPKLYLQHGGIYEIPDLVFSYYPMNLDLLYTGALYIGSDILPKYIHMTFGLATAVLLYIYLKRRLSKKYACLGSLFFLSIPIIVKLSTTVYVDLGLIFFSTASLLLLFRWLENSCSTKYLILSGLCCGLALGTKYNGLLVLFLLTLFVPILFIRSPGQQTKGNAILATRSACLFFFFALLAASPWLIRNIIWTGNPIFPLYDNIFNPSAVPIVSTLKESSQPRGIFATRYVLYGENIWQLLMLPVRIFFEGMDNDPRYFDGRLNPFLLLLPFFAFPCRSTQNRLIRLEKTTFLAFSLLYFLFAFNTSVLRVRYLAPIVPFLVLLAMYGLHNIETKLKEHIAFNNKALTIWLFLICLMLSWNGIYIYQQFQKTEPLSYLSGRLSRDEYLANHLPEYKVIQYINTHLPDSAKILCIFMGWRGYYLDRKHVFDYQTNRQWLLAWLKEDAITIEEIVVRLKNKKISHLLIRRDLLANWLQHGTNSQQSLWKLFEKNHLMQLTSHQNYSLYKLNIYNRIGTTTLPPALHNDTLNLVK